MKVDKIAKKSAPLTSKLVAAKGRATPVQDVTMRELSVDAEPAADTPMPVSVTEPAKAEKAAKPAKPAKTAKPVKVLKKPLNFKVPADFRREFKTYASTHDLKLNQLLELAFESYRKQRGD